MIQPHYSTTEHITLNTHDRAVGSGPASQAMAGPLFARAPDSPLNALHGHCMFTYVIMNDE